MREWQGGLECSASVGVALASFDHQCPVREAGSGALGWSVSRTTVASGSSPPERGTLFLTSFYMERRKSYLELV